MASERQAFIFILFSLLTFLSFPIKLSQAADSAKIAVYWGQNKNDDSLKSTCDTGDYNIVIIAFLNVFGHGKTPKLNITTSTTQCVGGCTELESDIKHCQQNSVKVFLSLGGPYGDYGLRDASDATQTASYLYNQFLTGNKGPLGKVMLDGIDFHIIAGSNSSWNSLATELDGYRNPKQQSFYLSAAPQCSYPDYYLDAAIKTGVFNNIFIQFYNDTSCQYLPGKPNNFDSAWNTWSLNLVTNKSSIFVGLPASSTASPTGGYLLPASVAAQFSYLQKVSNYGGVLLWDRGNDEQTGYSSIIEPYALSN